MRARYRIAERKPSLAPHAQSLGDDLSVLEEFQVDFMNLCAILLGARMPHFMVFKRVLLWNAIGKSRQTEQSLSSNVAPVLKSFVPGLVHGTRHIGGRSATAKHLLGRHDPCGADGGVRNPMLKGQAHAFGW